MSTMKYTLSIHNFYYLKYFAGFALFNVFPFLQENLLNVWLKSGLNEINLPVNWTENKKMRNLIKCQIKSSYKSKYLSVKIFKMLHGNQNKWWKSFSNFQHKTNFLSLFILLLMAVVQNETATSWIWFSCLKFSI